MMTKLLALLALAGGGLLGGGLIGPEAGLALGAVAGLVVLIFRRLLRRLLLIGLVLGGLAIWLGVLPPPA